LPPAWSNATGWLVDWEDAALSLPGCAAGACAGTEVPPVASGKAGGICCWTASAESWRVVSSVSAGAGAAEAEGAAFWFIFCVLGCAVSGCAKVGRAAQTPPIKTHANKPRLKSVQVILSFAFKSMTFALPKSVTLYSIKPLKIAIYFPKVTFRPRCPETPSPARRSTERFQPRSGFPDGARGLRPA
jgi:hypothetical protein